MPKASKVYDASAATIQSASDLTGVSKVRDVLSSQQVKLRANKRFRSIVVATTMLAVFVDILGTAMTVPVLPSICGYARGGQVAAILNNPQITAAGLLASGSSSTSAPTPDTLAIIEKIRNSQGVAQLRAAGQLANFDAASSVDQFARLAVVEHTVIPYAFGGPVGTCSAIDV